MVNLQAGDIYAELEGSPDDLDLYKVMVADSAGNLRPLDVTIQWDHDQEFMILREAK